MTNHMVCCSCQINEVRANELPVRANYFENPNVPLNDYVDSYDVYSASGTLLEVFFILSKRTHLNWAFVKEYIYIKTEIKKSK